MMTIVSSSERVDVLGLLAPAKFEEYLQKVGDLHAEYVLPDQLEIPVQTLSSEDSSKKLKGPTVLQWMIRQGLCRHIELAQAHLKKLDLDYEYPYCDRLGNLMRAHPLFETLVSSPRPAIMWLFHDQILTDEKVILAQIVRYKNKLTKDLADCSNDPYSDENARKLKTIHARLRDITKGGALWGVIKLQRAQYSASSEHLNAPLSPEILAKLHFECGQIIQTQVAEKEKVSAPAIQYGYRMARKHYMAAINHMKDITWNSPDKIMKPLVLETLVSFIALFEKALKACRADYLSPLTQEETQLLLSIKNKLKILDPNFGQSSIEQTAVASARGPQSLLFAPFKRSSARPSLIKANDHYATTSEDSDSDGSPESPSPEEKDSTVRKRQSFPLRLTPSS